MSVKIKIDFTDYKDCNERVRTIEFPDKPHGIRFNGIRPRKMRVFGSIKDDVNSEEEIKIKKWFFRDAAYRLCPKEGEIIFYSETLKDFLGWRAKK